MNKETKIITTLIHIIDICVPDANDADRSSMQRYKKALAKILEKSEDDIYILCQKQIAILEPLYLKYKDDILAENLEWIKIDNIVIKYTSSMYISFSKSYAQVDHENFNALQGFLYFIFELLASDPHEKKIICGIIDEISKDDSPVPPVTTLALINKKQGDEEDEEDEEEESESESEDEATAKTSINKFDLKDLEKSIPNLLSNFGPKIAKIIGIVTTNMEKTHKSGKNITQEQALSNAIGSLMTNSEIKNTIGEMTKNFDQNLSKKKPKGVRSKVVRPKDGPRGDIDIDDSDDDNSSDE